MKKIILLLVLLCLSVTDFSFAQSKANSKKEVFQASYDNVKSIVESQSYKFVSSYVFHNKKREKSEETSNTITINKSTISGLLSGLSSEKRDYKINGNIENYKIDFKDDLQQINIEFSSGNRLFYIDIKANGNSFLTLKNSDNTTNSYVGKLERI